MVDNDGGTHMNASNHWRWDSLSHALLRARARLQGKILLCRGNGYDNGLVAGSAAELHWKTDVLFGAEI